MARLMSSFLAVAVGAVLTTVVLLSWAVNNPSQLQRIVPFNQTGREQGAIAVPTIDLSADRVVQVVEKASPAVVSVIATKDVPVIEQYFENPPSNPFNPFDDLFSPFRFQVPQYRQNGTEKREVGGGSGFLVSADGMIVTNRHVVQETDVEYTVFTSEGEKHAARVIARDPVNDVAVIKIDASNLPFLDFGDSDHLKPGQTAIAIGNALGEFRNTVSVGVISGLSRSIRAGDAQGQSEQLENVIQTDAAINPGNSGGPLIDLNGQVVGVNVAVALGSENIGFALPSNLVRSVVDSVKTTGKISRPFLGVRYVMITPAIAQQNHISVDHGALIASDNTNQPGVVADSPADKAGLKTGDVILEIDGQVLDSDHQLSSAIAKKRVGDTVTLKVLHNGVEQIHTLRLEEVPTE